MAATQKERVETSLSEVRVLVLGAQILLGFQCRASFEPGFPSLPGIAQYFQVTALVLLVVSMACMIAPAPHHRFVSGGHATARAERHTKRMALLALAPFALALGMNFSAVLARQVGLFAACGIGAAVAAAALSCWFGPALARHRSSNPKGDEMVSTKDRITELLPRRASSCPACRRCSASSSHHTSRRRSRGSRPGDVFVVTSVVLGTWAGAAVALACATGMVGLWFGVPLLAAQRHPG